MRSKSEFSQKITGATKTGEAFAAFCASIRFLRFLLSGWFESGCGCPAIRHLTLTFTTALLAASSCAAADFWPVSAWQTTPEDERLFREPALALVRTFVREQNTRTLLIVQGGRLEVEWYFDGATAEDKVGSASMAKSFTSAAVGIAMAEGYLAGTQTTLADWFPDWTAADATGWLARVTLADLLTMRSGLPYNMKLQVAMHQAPGYLGFIQQQTPERAPGERFLYSGFDPILISAILQKATGRSLAAYAREKIFEPLGIRDAQWSGDPEGLTNGGSLIDMTARDYARFGLLYLRDGRWRDRQIVPAAWVRRSTANQFAGWPWYGFYWWRLTTEVESSDARLRGCYYAAGAGGQHIIILPALDTIVVRLGTEPLLTPSAQKFVPELCRVLLKTIP